LSATTRIIFSHSESVWLPPRCTSQAAEIRVNFCRSKSASGSGFRAYNRYVKYVGLRICHTGLGYVRLECAKKVRNGSLVHHEIAQLAHKSDIRLLFCPRPSIENFYAASKKLLCRSIKILCSSIKIIM
jgi:hypothetical protein